MISIQQDPQHPDRLTLTATVTLYVDRLLTDVLSHEVRDAIREQVIKDLAKRGVVRKAIQQAASHQLPAVLATEAESAVTTLHQEPIKTQTNQALPETK